MSEEQREHIKTQIEQLTRQKTALMAQVNAIEGAIAAYEIMLNWTPQETPAEVQPTEEVQ